MARVWAQEWRTQAGNIVYTVHVYQQDIVQFGRYYNVSQHERNMISQTNRAWQTQVDDGTVEKIHDHGYGLVVDGRPR